jgi:hypothetical protein
MDEHKDMTAPLAGSKPRTRTFRVKVRMHPTN